MQEAPITFIPILKLISNPDDSLAPTPTPAPAPAPLVTDVIEISLLKLIAEDSNSVTPTPAPASAPADVVQIPLIQLISKDSDSETPAPAPAPQGSADIPLLELIDDAPTPSPAEVNPPPLSPSHATAPAPEVS